MKNSELVDLVNSSPSPCLQRTKRLVKERLNTHDCAETSYDQIGGKITVFTKITLWRHDGQNLKAFESGNSIVLVPLDAVKISVGFATHHLTQIVRRIGHSFFANSSGCFAPYRLTYPTVSKISRHS